MFAIYTPTGMTFSGSLERLQRVEKISPSNTTRSTAEFETDTGREPLPGRGNHYTVSAKATEQYRKLLAHEERREPVYHAYQIMSTSVKTIASESSLIQAIQQFRQLPYQVFPVINLRRELVGALSRRQLFEYILSSGLSSDLKSQPIEDSFLTADSQVYTADPVTDVRRITTLMVEKNLDAVPVVEETGRLVGIVSRSDILRCAVDDPPLSLWC